MKARRCSLREKLLNFLAAVSRRAIPDNEQLPLDFFQQLFEEGDHALTVKGLRLQAQIQLTIGGNGTDNGEVIAGQLAT